MNTTLNHHRFEKGYYKADCFGFMYLGTEISESEHGLSIVSPEEFSHRVRDLEAGEYLVAFIGESELGIFGGLINYFNRRMTARAILKAINEMPYGSSTKVNELKKFFSASGYGLTAQESVVDFIVTYVTGPLEISGQMIDQLWEALCERESL